MTVVHIGQGDAMPIFSREEIEMLLERWAAQSAAPRDDAFRSHRAKCINAGDFPRSDKIARPSREKPAPAVWHPALARGFLARR
jgi:hypothetical protein